MIPRLRMLALALAVMLLGALPANADVAGLPAPKTLTLRLPDLGPNYELVSGRCGERSPGEARVWPSTLPTLSARFCSTADASSRSRRAGSCPAGPRCLSTS